MASKLAMCMEHHKDRRGQNLPQTALPGVFPEQFVASTPVPGLVKEKRHLSFLNPGSVATKSVYITIKSDLSGSIAGQCTLMKNSWILLIFSSCYGSCMDYDSYIGFLKKLLVFQQHLLKKIIMNERERFFFKYQHYLQSWKGLVWVVSVHHGKEWTEYFKDFKSYVF